MANDYPQRTRRDDETKKPAHEGDILGLGDASPDVEIPRATSDHGGHPQGIDVREPATGIGDVRQSSGATGIDMGHGGEGTNISARPRRPATADSDEDEK